MDIVACKCEQRDYGVHVVFRETHTQAQTHTFTLTLTLSHTHTHVRPHIRPRNMNST